MTKIVNIKKEKYTLYIGRKNLYYNEPVDSKWANKYVIGKDGIREEVIEKYKQDLLNNPKLLEDLHEIDNQILGCYCAPDFACHGEVLIELRNKQIEEQNNKKPLKTIIAGSRTINDYNLVKQAIYDSGFVIGEVVCGEATGPDSLGKKWAIENNIPVKSFPADWYNLEKQPCKIKISKNGKKYNILAGFNRNLEMAEYTKPNGALICVHNNSNGSLNMIKLAKERGLRIYEKVVNG